MGARFWISENQLKKLVEWQHRATRETAVREIMEWQLMGDFTTPESKKIFKQMLVQMLYQFGAEKQNGKMGEL